MKSVGGKPTAHTLSGNILGTALTDFKISLFDIENGLLRIY